jgi:predicted PurR-regulated permease PerM
VTTGRAIDAHRVLRSASIVLALGAGAALLVYAADVFLVVFAGILIANLLRTPSEWLSEKTGVAPNWYVGAVTLALIAVITVAAWLMAPRIAAQFGELTEGLTDALSTLQQGIEDRLNIDIEEDFLPNMGDNGPPFIPMILGRVTGMISGALGAVVNVVVILALGFYLALHSRFYVEGVVRLFTIQSRPRVTEIVQETGLTLRWWLFGQLITMVVVGMMTTTGLWLLGIPLAGTLGLITGLFEFAPFIGPILAAVPALLIAFTQSPMDALYVLLLFVAIQQIEGYVITPYVQQRAIEMPPALTIFAQLLMGVLFGLFGLLLATPLVAASMVVVKKAYIEDVLGDRGERTSAEGRCVE